MPASISPFQRFSRLSLACFAVLFVLGGLQWEWVRSTTRTLVAAPERTVFVAAQRMHALRLTSSTIAFMQAPGPLERSPYEAERRAARLALETAAPRMMDDEGPGAASTQRNRDADAVRRQLLRIIGRSDSLTVARQNGRRGPLSESEIRQSIAIADSLIAAIDRFHAREIAAAHAHTDALERTQAVVFLLMSGACLLMGLVVLRPAARDMARLAEHLEVTLAETAAQAHRLEESTYELEAQNLELVNQKVAMEQHRGLLMELQLSASLREVQHRAVLESMAEGMILRRQDGRLLSWNPEALRLLGLEPDDDLEAFTAVMVAEDEYGQPLQGSSLPLHHTLRTGEALTSFVCSFVRADGEKRWLRANTRLADFEDAGGNEQHAAVITFADVTEERRIAQQLRSFSVVLEQTDQAIAMTDAKLRLTWVNAAWSRITGFTAADALGHKPGDLLHGTHTASETVERMRTAVREGEGFEGEVLNYRRDGTPFWMEVHTTPLRDARGVITAWVSVQRDVTSRKAAERERQQLAAALAVTTDGIGIVSVGGGLEFVNHAYARAHGDRPRQFIGRPWTQRFPEDEALRIEAEVIPQVTRLGAWSGEVTGRRADGSTFPQELSITLLPTGGLVCVTRDTTDRKHAEEQLRAQAVRDELTQLYNRRGFFNVATERLQDARRRGAPAVLLYGDADKFKQVNDTHGHDIGDKVLQVIASVLRDNLRAIDVVARLGGDEFTALLVDASSEHANAIVRKIQQAFEEVNRGGIIPSAIGMSIGTAVFDPAQPISLDDLMRAADTSLYDVKRFRTGHRSAA